MRHLFQSEPVKHDLRKRSVEAICKKMDVELFLRISLRMRSVEVDLISGISEWRMKAMEKSFRKQMSMLRELL